MEKQQALTLLGLNEHYSAADLASAVVAKKQLVQQKREAAPTEALKAKFEMMLLQVDEAAAVLQTESTQTKASSPLSQTKLADLPSMAAGDAEQLTLQQGQVLAGRYEVKELLGQGGMGAVYRAFDKSMSRDIALKVLLPSLIKNDNARERFLNEAKISQQLSHPNIVNVFDVQNDGDLYFLTMELLEGQDLRQVMENRKLARQPFTVDEAQEIAKAICAALSYAHKYTIHRDLKPENVWLTDEGVYKLMDFGIAQVQSTSQRTKTGAAMGTAYYMAPEQLKGQKDIDGRADQYALAVLIYELLSGEVPAGMIEPLQSHRKDIPKTLADAVHKALATKPENRFATLAEFIAALTSKRSSATMPSLPWKPIGIAAGVLVALLGVGGVLSSGSMDFKSFLPKSQAELSQQKAELAKLLGQINVTKKRLEEGRRKLENDVRDAERDQGNTARLAELTHWHTITESALFNGTQITELEGELAMAEAFNRDGSLTQAKTSYEKVLAGYTVLLDEFNSAEFLQNAAAANAKAEQEWLAIKAEYNLEDPQAVADATTQEKAAKSEEQQSHFKAALVKWREAKSSWDSAPNAFGERIATTRKEKAAAELAAANELKQRQQAASESKRKAEEAQAEKEAEKKRKIADAEREAQQKLDAAWRKVRAEWHIYPANDTTCYEAESRILEDIEEPRNIQCDCTVEGMNHPAYPGEYKDICVIEFDANLIINNAGGFSFRKTDVLRSDKQVRIDYEQI